MSSALRTPLDVPLASRLPWAALVLGLVAVLVAFRDTWSGMAHVWWTSETFGHGMVVPALAAWLGWRNRDRLRRAEAAVDWRGVVAFAAACGLWLVGDLAGTAVVAQFAVTAMIPAVVWSIGGPGVLRVLLAPLAFLFFMVPAGEALNPVLMAWTADATIAAIQAVGIPVFREGLHFSLPTGRWSVVEACSGLRYVIAAAMLSTLFALLNFRSLGRQVAFVLGGLALAILANWARAFLVVMTGHFSGMRWGVGDDHIVFGWVFFGIAMLGVFAMGARWRDLPTEGTASPAMSGPVPAGSSGVAGWGFGLPGAAVLAGLAFATAAWVDAARDVQPRDVVARSAPAVLGALSPDPAALSPDFSGARATVEGRRSDGVAVFLAYYARQQEGTEMIAFGNAVLPGREGRWAALSSEDRLQAMAGSPLRVREQRIRAEGGERLAWTWYTVGGLEAGGSEYRAKAATAWAMLRGRGDHSTVSVASVALPDLPAAAPEQALRAALESARARLVGAAEGLRTLSLEATGP